jgi:hypothetical protein
MRSIPKSLRNFAHFVGFGSLAQSFIGLTYSITDICSQSSI